MHITLPACIRPRLLKTASAIKRTFVRRRWCVCVYYMQGTCLECDEERPPRAALAGHRLPEHLARRRRRRRPQLEPAYVLAQRDNAAAELPETQDRLTTLRPESC